MTDRYCGEWNHRPGVMSTVWGCGFPAHFLIQSANYVEDDARERALWVCADCFDRMIEKGSVKEV